MSRNTKNVPNGHIIKRLAAEGNTISTSAMQIGANAVEASEHMKGGEAAALAWLESVGLALPEAKFTKQDDGTKSYKVVKREWKGAGGVLGRATHNAATGKPEIWLSDRAQSALLRDVIFGVAQYIETKYKQDVSPCILTWSETQAQYAALPKDSKLRTPEKAEAMKRHYCQPQIVAGAKRMKDLSIDASKVAVLRMAFNRAKSILGRVGVKITLEMQTAKGKNGGRKGAVKPAYAALNKLVKYIVDRRERMN